MLKAPVEWETHPCSQCEKAYRWPRGLSLPHTRTCGAFECLRRVVTSDILSHQAIDQYRRDREAP